MKSRCVSLLVVCLLSSLFGCIRGGGLGSVVWADDVGDLGLDESLIKPPFAWNRDDRYEAPDFEKFFADDPQAGKQLDLWIEKKLKLDSVDEELALIRRGLRRCSKHRTLLLSSIGNRFVWNKDPQDPRVIELLYHASDSPSGDVTHYALYFGATVVSQRSANLVQMLMQRYHALDTQMQQRIAWGMKQYGEPQTNRELLEELLEKHETLDANSVTAAIETYRGVFGDDPPRMERFQDLGLWVIAFHRTDVSASHPDAAKILKDSILQRARGSENQLVEFVTRVENGYEVGVALVRGEKLRDELKEFLSTRQHTIVDFDELLTSRMLQERRLREFASHLSTGLPEYARPEYSRPDAEVEYGYAAAEFVAPNFEKFFPDDIDAARKLDEVYKDRTNIELNDRELLNLFRRGLRQSEIGANTMFGWLVSALGWPRDPLLTEILYQALDPKAPQDVYTYALYYGFGLGTEKSPNVLEAICRIYITAPFDRTTNQNMRSRILWSVRDHEDDKNFLATRFAVALKDHAQLSDVALLQIDRAYRQLTERTPENANDYADRGVFLVIIQDASSRTLAQSEQLVAARIDVPTQVLETKVEEKEGRFQAIVIVKGISSLKEVVERLQKEPRMAVYFADLLTQELIDNAQGQMLQPFEKYVNEK